MKRFSRVLFVRPGLEFLAVEQRFGDGALWNLPGGKVEADESPKIAAIREVYEEIGYLCKPSQLRFLCKKPLRIKDTQWQGYFYIYLSPMFKMQIMESEKLLNIAWLDHVRASSKNAMRPAFHDVLDAAMKRIELRKDPWTNLLCAWISQRCDQPSWENGLKSAN